MHAIQIHCAVPSRRRSLLTSEQITTTLSFLDRVMSSPASPAKTLALFARCCLYLMSAQGQAHRAGEEAESFAREVLMHPTASNLGLDPWVLCAYYTVLREAGERSSSFEEILSSLNQELRALPVEARSAPRLRHTAALLNACDLGTMPEQHPALVSEYLSSPARLAKLSDEQLQDVIDNLCADHCEMGAEMAEMLSMIALAELRDYRIDLAAQILRRVLATPHRPPFLAEAIDFILLQRCADGGYGFLDPFTDQSKSAQERLEQFQLPMTLNAVWVILSHERQTLVTPVPSVAPMVRHGKVASILAEKEPISLEANRP